MVFAGLSHLFWARREFQAQVPDWTEKVIDKDAVVVASGVVEVMLGAALVALPRERSRVGALLAAFLCRHLSGQHRAVHEGEEGVRHDRRPDAADPTVLPACARRGRRVEHPRTAGVMQGRAGRARLRRVSAADGRIRGCCCTRSSITTEAVASTSSRLAKIDALADAAAAARRRTRSRPRSGSSPRAHGRGASASAGAARDARGRARRRADADGARCRCGARPAGRRHPARAPSAHAARSWTTSPRARRRRSGTSSRA